MKRKYPNEIYKYMKIKTAQISIQQGCRSGLPTDAVDDKLLF